MKNYHYVFICMFFLNAVSIGQSIDLSQSKCSFRKAGDAIWLSATVPGTVHAELLATKNILDHFFRSNEQDQQ